MKTQPTGMPINVEIDVHAPNEPVTSDDRRPWVGIPPDRCVRDLLLFLNCCLSTDYWLRGDQRCDSALRNMTPRRFVIPPESPNADQVALLTRVRRSLLGDGGGGDPTISRVDYETFVRFALPESVEKLPYVVTVNGVHFSWFVCVVPHKEYVGALGLNPVLRLSVLADAALHPPEVGEDDEGDWVVYRRLEDIAQLVRFVQRMRADPETGGLRYEDRKALFDATMQVLGKESPGRARPRDAEARDPVESQLQRLATEIHP